MINKVRTMLSNKDTSQLLKNFFSLALLKLVNSILPFVTLPYLIKVLGIEQYGAIVLGLALIAYFQAITDYGFNLSATREIAKHRTNAKQLSFIYSKTIITKVCLLLFCLAILIPIILFVPQFKEDLVVYLLMCLTFIGQTLFPEWFFRGVEKMGYIAGLNFVVKMSFTIGVFTLIKAPEDYWLYPFLLGVSYIIVSIVSHYIIVKNFKVHLFFINPARIKKTLKIGYPLFVNQFVPNLFNNTTNFLIGIILGKSSAGYFSATRKVVQILSVFDSVVSNVAFPYLIRYKEKFSIFSKYYLLFIGGVSVFVALLHPYVFDIIGIDYQYDSEVFYILLLGFLSIVFYSVYSTNYLISRGHDKVVMRLTIVTSVLGFILSFPLIYQFGLLGGALNIFIAQFILGFGSYFYSKKVSKQVNYAN
ncbi:MULTISPECIES: oligosaccharide flippase family protein [unclassified Psychrobacter]|uniref:oligosaccharide flippase family protein n=1 Tax=unclassified Psychrobacter TaxID=196806 RepID=UPI00078D67A2|nr:oligosaccharide flippase family protein [Psychrobacter sp. P11G5]AMN66915.1 polysaccharide biosynthesis protein [Psychrobacter sp. P11G5]